MECKHLDAELRGGDRVGFLYCPKCEETVPMHEVLRNLLEESQRVREEINNELGRLRSTNLPQ